MSILGESEILLGLTWLREEGREQGPWCRPRGDMVGRTCREGFALLWEGLLSTPVLPYDPEQP